MQSVSFPERFQIEGTTNGYTTVRHITLEVNHSCHTKRRLDGKLAFINAFISMMMTQISEDLF